MTAPGRDVTNEQIERLCAGYRAGVEEPAFGAADQALLRAAARSARYRSLQRRLYAPSTLALAALLAVLASAAAGWLGLSAVRGSAVTPATALIAHDGGAAPPVLLVVAAPVIRPAAALFPPSGEVDLNAPGALASLHERRPDDYARIVAILAGITQRPQGDVPRWMQAVFDARDVVYQPLWLTSFPPKRQLSFSLEAHRYRAVVTITDQGARVFPADSAMRCQVSGTHVCGDPAFKGKE